MTPPLEDLTIEEKRLIASMEAEARFYQQIAGFYEKLTVLSMSSIAGAIAVAGTFSTKLGAAAELIYLFRGVLAFMAAALVGAYGMLMNTYVASSRLMWISYMQHKGDRPALTGIGEKWGFLAFVFMEGRKREGPSIGLLNGFVKKNAMALLLLVIFGYGLEQFVSFAFRSLSLIVNQPGH